MTVTSRLARAAANGLLKMTFAPPCAACGEPLESPVDGCVCDRCWAAIEPAPRVDWPAGPLVAVAAAGDYIGSLRHIVHAFKYEGRRSLARPLGDRMRAASGSILAGADCVVPVPLHPWRRMRRGFNQAADLAATLGVPVTAALWRVRATTPQADLTAAERRRNVRDAFAVSPFLSGRARFSLRGQAVVLVDDVRTTGATLHACAEVLAAAGVREVRALTAAVREARPGHGQSAGESAAGRRSYSNGSTAA